MHLRQIAKNLMLSMSPSSSDLVTECKKLLADEGKILENMATKGTDPELSALTEAVVIDESESEVEESGPEIVAELPPLPEEVSSRSTEVEELPNEILMDLSPEPTME